MPIIIDPKHVDRYVLKYDRELPASEDHPAKYAADQNEILTTDNMRELSGLKPNGLNAWLEAENAKRRKRRWVFCLAIPRPQQRAVIRDTAKPGSATAFKLGSWEYHTVRASLKSIEASDGCELAPPAFDLADGGMVPDHAIALLTTDDLNEITNRVTDMMQAKAADLGNSASP